MMEDIGLFKQGWIWLHSQKQVYSSTRTTVCCFRDRIMSLVELHWPMVCSGSVKLGKLFLMVLLLWRDCIIRGSRSLLGLNSAALLLIMWSCFLSLTSISCLAYVLLSLGIAGAAVRYLGYTPGLFIVGFFGILILWMYGNFLIAGILFIVGGYLFSLNHARVVVLMATAYAVYCVKVRVGWLGIFLSVNLAFFSNDLFNLLLQGVDAASEAAHVEEEKETESVTEDEFSEDFEFAIPTEESDNVHSCKSSTKTSPTSKYVDIKEQPSVSPVVKSEMNSEDEMKRILKSLDHYDALGLLRNNFNAVMLKKEYRKKAMLVHPDKNMGSQLACESFKKLQCAYEVLSDAEKRKSYDEQLRKEGSNIVCQNSHSSSQQDGADYQSEESRRIHCTKCGNSHIWICTNRTKAKARWCQDCCQYHPAKDGDGWVETGPLVFERSLKVEIPRAFVCAESKIFDVSEWAICQGMTCRPNTHRPSFQVNMVGEKMARSNSSRFPWDLDAEMMEEEEEFEIWLQQALASGLFSETSKRRKSWSPFKLHQKITTQWRRSP